MVVKLRLARHGRRHRPFYRIVCADSRAKRDGRHLDVVGTYNPIPNPEGLKEVRVRESRVKYWLSVGAQMSPRVEWLLGNYGITPMPPRKFSPVKMVPRSERRGMSTFARASALCQI
mmetsp:Transcript_11752/g.21807  ORF Transcript_11752/g.21807 Transcript_11752/m.21807 type:complete len:117 (-) Transcript_11752:80-430(-)